MPIARATSICGPGADTRVLTVLLAAAIPIAAVAALVRGAREQTETHSATRELTEGMLADHLARGSGPGSPASCTTWSRTTSR